MDSIWCDKIYFIICTRHCWSSNIKNFGSCCSCYSYSRFWRLYGMVKFMVVMRKNEILFSIAFLIIVYYTVTEKNFLSQMNTRDLVFHSILTLLAFAIAISNFIDLRKLKTSNFKYKVLPIFYIISSVLFIITSACSLFFI